ncbi:MAG: hypothetical protein K2X93_21110 [Candidatus Obscuribacterales bacterium]|nr:hypothetical protein [Candidatus Obscuribacterales bacterium]
MNTKVEVLEQWIRCNAKAANGLLIPVSGGSDGALTFALHSRVYPEKTVAVYAGTELRARGWFESIGPVRFIEQFDGEFAELDRFTQFQKLCKRENRWLVGTRNRTEDVFGTFSLPSRMATYLPIVGLWKSDVMELCKLVGVPEEVIESSRRADPDCGRPAELAEIGLENIDLFLKVQIGLLGSEALETFSAPQIEYLERAYKTNRFRSSLPVRGPTLDC